MPLSGVREEVLFELALNKPVDRRAAFLDAVCGDDAALRQRLEALLAAHEQPDRLLGTQSEPVRLGSKASAQRAPSTVKVEFTKSPDEEVGQTLGRYKLLENLGEGGCGVVYVAEQTEPVRRRVALKVIKLGMDTKAVVARFEAERQALAMMDHPNIAKVLDAGATETGRPYFVMELVRGIKITDYCDQHQLPTKERLDLFIKICQAIQHAHQKGIIHRDIKPSNILVTLHDGTPVPKVIDFGIAKATEGRLTDATVYTQLHQFIGTPAYMSPEQAEMSGLDIDTRSDIYSLGVLLYELLTGKTPFDPQELMDSGIDGMRKTIREKEPARPSTKLATLQGEELTTTASRRAVDASKLVHQLEGDLDWIVMKCLDKDRTRRYATANGLAVDIKRHLNHEPVVARPPSTVYRLQKAIRRNKLTFTAAAGIAAAMVIGSGVSTWQAVVARKAQHETELARGGEQQQRLEAQRKQAEAEAERQRADAQAQKASESQQQSRRLLYASDMNLAQQSLKQNNLGKARRLLERHRPDPGEEDLRGWEWRYLWQLTRSSALVTLTNRPTTRGFSVSFSRDGRRLAAGWYDGQVDMWDVGTQSLIQVITAPDHAHPGRVAFSPVRDLLAATSGSKEVSLYDLESGRVSGLWRVPKEGEWSIRELAFSQDGSRLVIYAGSTLANHELGDRVWVVNVGDARIESEHSAPYSDPEHHGAAVLSPDNSRLYLALSDSRNYQYSIQCLDLSSGRELWKTERQRDYGLTTLAASPDGRVIASGSGFEDPYIRIWDAATGRLQHRLDGHSAWVCKLTFSEDGTQLISAASDQTIRFWDTSTWIETRVLRGHTDEVHAVASSGSAQLVASASKDGDLMLWRASEASAPDGYRSLPNASRESDIVSIDGSHLLFLPADKPPQWLDLKGGHPAVELSEIATSSQFLGCFGSNTLCYWNGTNHNQMVIAELRGTQLTQLSAFPTASGSQPTSVAFNSTRQLMAWTDASASSVYVANLATLGRRVELRCDTPERRSLSFSEDGKYLFALAREREPSRAWQFLRLWDVDAGRIFTSIDAWMSGAAFCMNGRTLMVILSKPKSTHEIAFYDLTQPDRLPRRLAGSGMAASLAVSPQGSLAAVTTLGGQVRLYDVAKGELIEAVHGHLNAAFGVAFSPDGRRLISASGGREAVKLWDVVTRQELLTLSGTGSTLSLARWSADGDAILAGAPWQAWRAPSWAEIAAAEAQDKAADKRP